MPDRGSKGSKWVLVALVALLGYGAYQWLSERSPDTSAMQAAAPTAAPASSPPPPAPVAPPPSPPVGSAPVNTPPALAPNWQPPVMPPVQPVYVFPQAAVPVPPKLEPSLPWIEAPAAARIGEQFVVTVSVDSKSTALNSILLHLRYDVAKLSLQSVVVGDFMTQTGVPGDFASDANPNDGDVAVSLQADAGQSALGRGSVAVFAFEAIGEGNAVLEVRGFQGHEPGGRPVEVVNSAPQSISIDP